MTLPVPFAPDVATSDAEPPDIAMSDTAVSSPEALALARRHDGVTPERQRIFVQVLAATGSVAEAARQAGASRQAFYAHRTRDEGRDFQEAWNQALALSTQRLCDAAYERAINGVEEPIFHKGELVGTRRVYNDKLLMMLIALRGGEGLAPPPPAEPRHYGVPAHLLDAPPTLDERLAVLGLPEPEEVPPPPRRGRRRRGG